MRGHGAVWEAKCCPPVAESTVFVGAIFVGAIYTPSSQDVKEVLPSLGKPLARVTIALSRVPFQARKASALAAVLDSELRYLSCNARDPQGFTEGFMVGSGLRHPWLKRARFLDFPGCQARV